MILASLFHQRVCTVHERCGQFADERLGRWYCHKCACYIDVRCPVCRSDGRRGVEYVSLPA